jgi:hypothetical protein
MGSAYDQIGVGYARTRQRDHLPAIREVDRPRAPGIPEIASSLGDAEVRPVPISHDCADGFLGAFWRRPEAYLDARVRAGISACAMLPPRACDAGLAKLAADLESGAWHDRQRDRLELDDLDLGYRLIVADATTGSSATPAPPGAG